MILTLGGRFVIHGAMTLGDFTAFNSYLAILIFPVIVIGFMSNVMAQASASYARIACVLGAPAPKESGTIVADLRGDIALKHVVVTFGEKAALKDVSISIKAGTRTAVIGPTAAGKTQLLYLLTGLLAPTSGTRRVRRPEHRRLRQDDAAPAGRLRVPGRDDVQPDAAGEHRLQQDRDGRRSREGDRHGRAEGVHRRAAAEARHVVSERGTSLSGGQKQRIMLARALALNPRVLLLDDFTARVDATTERKILENVQRNYPGITLLSVTQKIAPVEDYDQIVLLMEGEVLAVRHAPAAARDVSGVRPDL